MRIPDWIVYGLALGLIVWVLFAADRNADAPEPAPEMITQEGPLLPPPSAFDDQILVRVDEPQDGIGTAFALNRQGEWLTARHVVEGCRDVGLLVGPGQYIPASRVEVAEGNDLAIVYTGRSPNPVALDTTTQLRVGDRGYHIGYPQGRPGEAASRLLARSKLVTSGNRRGVEPVLAWAEIGRTRGLVGSLGGLSGGPVFDAEGFVRGVIVAESPRRGRIYTAAPSAVASFLSANNVELEAGDTRAITEGDYGRRADDARRALKVAKVACRVGR